MEIPTIEIIIVLFCNYLFMWSFRLLVLIGIPYKIFSKPGLKVKKEDKPNAGSQS